MTPIVTQRLILRNWRDGDRDLFHRINSDDRVMEFFPFRRDRAASDALLERLAEEIADRGFGLAAAELRASGECIGFVGLRETSGLPSFPAGMMEIGWRLAPEFWGKGYVTEAGSPWLRFGFETLDLKEIISFAVWNNHRSIAVMRRLGMRADPARDFDHPAVPDTHPHLKRHAVYRIGQEEWQTAIRATDLEPSRP